jgi:signal transduction histidine kinase/ActR/RegA family two-component response regulator
MPLQETELSFYQPTSPERTLILAPQGRDAIIAADILNDAGLEGYICRNLAELVRELHTGADAALLTEEVAREADPRDLTEWVARQPAWSDFPFVVLTRHGGGLERNPMAAQFVYSLGNVTFLERPFHPTTLISVVHTCLRGRRRQHECRRLNEELELRVDERTAELGAANRQLLAQIGEREKVEATLTQIQRLEAVGQLTSGVAHDFNNLLTVVLGNVEFLERGLAGAGIDGKMKDRLSYLRQAAERGARLTHQLLSFSRRQRLKPKPLDLNEVVLGMRDLMQSTIGGGVEISTSLERALWSAMADSTQLELAIINLAINARDAMKVGGRLVVGTTNVALSEPQRPEEPAAGDYVAVFVADSGCGMTDEVRAKVFEPFFTTKEVGKGSGLGLSQILGFAKQSGGGVRIETEPGKGTTVFIYLPRTREQREVERRDLINAQKDADLAGRTVLLVDDDNAVREVARAMLHDLGCRVLEAGSGGAALELLKQQQQVDLAIIDFAMPGMNGAEVAAQIQKSAPSLPVLYVTGFAELTLASAIDERNIISKPFNSYTLQHKIRQALGGRPAVAAT